MQITHTCGHVCEYTDAQIAAESAKCNTLEDVWGEQPGEWWIAGGRCPACEQRAHVQHVSAEARRRAEQEESAKLAAGMTPIRYEQLDSMTLAEALKKAGVVVTEIEDLTHAVSHVGFGGAAKSTYYSPKSHRTIYVLERNGMYAADAYANDVWQFTKDFTAKEADAFIKQHDSQRKVEAAS